MINMLYLVLTAILALNVSSEVLDAYEHQLFTFGSLLKKLHIARDSSRLPLVPVMFNIDMGLDDDVEFYQLHHKLISNPRESTSRPHFYKRIHSILQPPSLFLQQRSNPVFGEINARHADARVFARRAVRRLHGCGHFES